jgi:hypothetical protein
MDTVNCDQLIKADGGKPKLSLVPPQIIFDIAKVREYGCNKYPNGGPNNWMLVEPERYRDAAFRHLLAYISDPQGVDEESGLPHLWHLACNVAFLCELEKIRETDEPVAKHETSEGIFLETVPTLINRSYPLVTCKHYDYCTLKALHGGVCLLDCEDYIPRNKEKGKSNDHN